MTGLEDTGPKATDFAELTPRQVVTELDRYIIGQDKAKRAVAIALRNRWRRRNVAGELKDEILPNNIIMIGPTGVGKTEIARRLARLAGAPFVKLEASKFTEVGYVGRDVESMVRDLVEFAVNLVRTEREDECREIAADRVEERLLDLLLPPVAGESSPGDAEADGPRTFVVGSGGARVIEDDEPDDSPEARRRRTREKLRGLLRDERLEDRDVEIDVAESSMPAMDMSASGMEGLDWNFMEVLQDMLPKRSRRRTVTVAEARKYLLSEELGRLVDMDEVVDDALDRAETMGIIFLDELDKVATKGAPGGPDVSREGVQRDLLPIVEGATVSTKHGLVKTDHILFIASGAFHVSKPSDLIPELQGRFPLRVELHSLGKDEFIRILTEPENALTKQYVALMATEGIDLSFDDDAIEEMARIAVEVNERTEEIGARRLHTIIERVLDDLSFDASERDEGSFKITAQYVNEQLKTIVDDQDLSRFIL